MITKQTIIDKIEVLAQTGHIQIREATQIIEDGEVISQSYHRRVVEPDADITAEPDMLKAIHGASVSEEHKAAAAARRANPQAV